MNARPLSLTLALFASACGESPVASNQPSSPDLDAEESAALYEVDRLREGSGVPGALIVCKALSASASAHSDDMRDVGYVAEEGADGSTPRERGCEAGYTPACETAASLTELIASGSGTGKDLVASWAADAGSRAALLDASMIVAGIGRAKNGEGEIWWTLDLASVDHASCE